LTNSPSGSLCPYSRESSPSNSTEEDNDDSPNPPNDNDDDNNEDLTLTPPMPSMPTTARMANFDAKLKHFVIDIMKYKLAQPLAMALDQAFVSAFDELTYKAGTCDSVKLYTTLVKQIQRGVACARYKEDMADVQSDDPAAWDADTFSKWTQNGYFTDLNTVAVSAAALAATTVGSTTTTIISTSQKDDEAALISWNRKPRDVAKYPFLKTDADYQDWKLKMKRQLIAGTLS
jgi:hypothetical protein